MRFSSRHVVIALLVIGASACGSSSNDAEPTTEPVAPSDSLLDVPASSAVQDPEATGAPDSDTGTSGGNGAPSTSAPAPTGAVPEALQFTAPLVGGGEFSGAELADKPTVFWFWAPT